MFDDQHYLQVHRTAMGDQDGPIVCKSVSGEVRQRPLETYYQHTFYVVEIY